MFLLLLLLVSFSEKRNFKEKEQSMAWYPRDCFPVIIQSLFILLQYLGDSIKCRALVLGAL